MAHVPWACEALRGTNGLVRGNSASQDQSAADLVRFEFGGPAKLINGFSKSARVIKWPADFLEPYQREDGSSDSAPEAPETTGANRSHGATPSLQGGDAGV
jgi:hypothetical protein